MATLVAMTLDMDNDWFHSNTCVTQLIYHYDTLGSLSRTEVRSDVSAHKIDRFSFEVAPSNLGMSGANPSLD